MTVQRNLGVLIKTQGILLQSREVEVLRTFLRFLNLALRASLAHSCAYHQLSATNLQKATHDRLQHQNNAQSAKLDESGRRKKGEQVNWLKIKLNKECLTYKTIGQKRVWQGMGGEKLTHSPIRVYISRGKLQKERYSAKATTQQPATHKLARLVDRVYCKSSNKLLNRNKQGET